MSILRNWELIDRGRFVIRGEVYDDSRWKDGEPIQTSIVEVISFGKDEVIVKTKNSTYELQYMKEKP